MLGGCSLSTPKWSCRKCCYHFTQNPCGGTISVIAMFQQSDNACASTAESLSCGSEGGGCETGGGGIRPSKGYCFS